MDKYQNKITKGICPPLTTHRFYLDPLNISHTDALFYLRSNHLVNKYIDRKKPENLSDVLTFIQSVRQGIEDGTKAYWSIFPTGQTELIGTICLFNFTPDGKSAELGFELNPSWWGKGVMGECARTVIQFFVREKNAEKLVALTNPENTNSIHLLKALGFYSTGSIQEGYQVFALELPSGFKPSNY